MTSALRGVLEMMTHDDRGEGGVKNCQNGGDIICGCPLRAFSYLYLDVLLSGNLSRSLPYLIAVSCADSGSWVFVSGK